MISASRRASWQIDLEASFYVGDAAGRPADPAAGRMVKDHSGSDKGFAEEVGIRFQVLAQLNP